MGRPRKNGKAVEDAQMQAEATAVAEIAGDSAQEQAVTETEVPSGPINMIVEKKSPPVKILYIDSVIANNQVPIGPGRYITGSGRVFSVSLDQFEGEFMTPLTMELIRERKFVILSGLSDEQREQYGCLYTEGEVVKNEGVFDALITESVEKAVRIFGELCQEHRQMAATRFMTAYYEKHDNRLTRDRIEALNKIGKQNGEEGLFAPILKEMNDKSL